jgi:hypothetical protein
MYKNKCLALDIPYLLFDKLKTNNELYITFSIV